MTKLQQYSSYDLDTLMEEEAFVEENKPSSSGRASYFKPIEGKNVIRVLPAHTSFGRTSPVKIISEHFIRLPDGTPFIFACPRVMVKDKCRVCEKGFALHRKDNEKDKETGKKLLPRMRYYMNVIDRNNPEKGPMIYGASATVFDLLKQIRKDADDGGDFTNPETGFDIIITRTGKGQFDTRYQVMPSRKVTPLGDEEWIAQQSNLEFLGRILTDEQIEARLTGQATRGSEIKADPVKETTVKPDLNVDEDDDLFDVD